MESANERSCASLKISGSSKSELNDWARASAELVTQNSNRGLSLMQHTISLISEIPTSFAAAALSMSSLRVGVAGGRPNKHPGDNLLLSCWSQLAIIIN